MEQKTGIRSLYDEFFQDYEAEIRLDCPDSAPARRISEALRPVWPTIGLDLPPLLGHPQKYDETESRNLVRKLAPRAGIREEES
jgi:hypothetical protein